MSLFENGSSSNEFEEICIQVEWGHVAAKWWGSKDIRPIICLHGWQDNAGTFDRLIPLLPDHVSYLAIDFPGHGLSSHYPDGMAYSLMDYVQLLRTIQDFYKWDKISILGHSLGSIVGFLFNAFYPELCDMMIGIDILKPLVRENHEVIALTTVRMDKLLEENKRRSSKSKPPTYTIEEIIRKIHEGSNKSVSLDGAVYLAKRAVKESDNESNRYYFARDNRLKYFHFQHFSTDLINSMIGNILAPYFFIKAKDGPYYEDKKYFDDAIATFQKLSNFQHISVDGSHHVQLSCPANVSEPISNFIEINRPK